MVPELRPSRGRIDIGTHLHEPSGLGVGDCVTVPIECEIGRHPAGVGPPVQRSVTDFDPGQIHECSALGSPELLGVIAE